MHYFLLMKLIFIPPFEFGWFEDNLSLFYNVLFVSYFLFFTFCFFSSLQLFYQQLYFLLHISYFFRSSLTFISGDIKQKIKSKKTRQCKKDNVKNNKRQETRNKKHIVEQVKKDFKGKETKLCRNYEMFLSEKVFIRKG